eukprot:365113-Chlamydomonas_euryale.AAC.8
MLRAPLNSTPLPSHPSRPLPLACVHAECASHRACVVRDVTRVGGRDRRHLWLQLRAQHQALRQALQQQSVPRERRSARRAAYGQRLERRERDRVVRVPQLLQQLPRHVHKKVGVVGICCGLACLAGGAVVGHAAATAAKVCVAAAAACRRIKRLPQQRRQHCSQHHEHGQCYLARRVACCVLHRHPLPKQRLKQARVLHRQAGFNDDDRRGQRRGRKRRRWRASWCHWHFPGRVCKGHQWPGACRAGCASHHCGAGSGYAGMRGAFRGACGQACSQAFGRRLAGRLRHAIRH